MSTKVSLSYGPNYHLYQEIFDTENLYLTVHGHEFEASNDKVMVQIPIDVWKKMLDDWPKTKYLYDNKQSTEDWVESLEWLEKTNKPTDETIIFKKRNK